MAAVNIKLNPLGVFLILLGISCVVFYAMGGMKWFQSEQKVSMKQLLAVGIDLAKRGGLRVKEIRESNRLNEKTKGLTEEGAKELKTEGDMQSHRAIVYGFAKAFPGLKVISEEHERKPVDFKSIPDPTKQLDEVDAVVGSDQMVPMKDITVWIDPLDATQEYTEDLTHFVTTMVCVAVKGVPMIGVIHQPFLKETAWAWVGYGFAKSLKVAKKEDRKDSDPYKIIVSRSHAGEVKAAATESFGASTIVIPAGGAGYKTLAVIKGEADAYIHTTLIKKWDICAGNALLHAVGGHMTTLDGTYIDYSSNLSEKNDKGLLASLYGYSTYRTKLASIAEKMKKKEKPKEATKEAVKVL
ncbi:inositol monophosphatase 3-like [Lineus longissimus]|uniref:inositol monophosphatase 3-like n=1 Tax=Lineus longissimus TaxID=88925 RepID=UPI002B4D7BF8